LGIAQILFLAMTRRLEIVIAGDSRENVERVCGPKTWRVLADNGFVDRLTVRCVGFFRDLETNSLLLVLPKAFGSSEIRQRLTDPTYRREQLYRLLRVFRKIRRETQLTVMSGETKQFLQRCSNTEDPVLDSLDAAIKLRRDYREHGLYIRKTARTSSSHSNYPVNWPSTIRGSKVLLGGQGLFFDKTIHNARKRDIGHPLTSLHLACLKEIFEITAERADLAAAYPLDPVSFSRIKANPRAYLRAMSASVYDDRGRFLISAISSFLGESSLVAADHLIREPLLSYTKDFEDIWEHILRDLISPSESPRTLVPGQWYEWPTGISSKGMQPEFDIRLKTGCADVLVDAKDYRLFNGAKWQGTNGDHYKQIIYGQLLGSPLDTRVVNMLAFPSMGQENLFAIRGCHVWKEMQGSCVFEITVDYDLALKRWLREMTLDVFSEFSSLTQSLREFMDRLSLSG
jgi:hypothetical protein